MPNIRHGNLRPAGQDDLQSLAKAVLEILEPSNGATPPSEEELVGVLALADSCLASRQKKYPGNHWGRYLRHYDDVLQRSSAK